MNQKGLGEHLFFSTIGKTWRNFRQGARVGLKIAVAVMAIAISIAVCFGPKPARGTTLVMISN
jgi:hypothetical protein